MRQSKSWINLSWYFRPRVLLQKVNKKKEAKSNEPESSGPAKMRLEKKGRGGKQVTILYDLPLSKMEAKNLMREIQKILACGASYKNREIILSGEHRDAAEKIFLIKK